MTYSSLILHDKERVGEWVAEQVGQYGGWGSFYAFGAEVNGEIVAGVVVNNFNEANATAHIAIKKRTKLIIPLFRVVASYAFKQCGLKRLTGMVPTNEPKTIAFDKKLGFEEEFVMKDGAPGADMMFLVLWPDKCRWLQEA